MTSGRLILAATGLAALATLGPAAGAGATSFTVTAAAAALQRPPGPRSPKSPHLSATLTRLPGSRTGRPGGVTREGVP
jgi:hypothetical protein